MGSMSDMSAMTRGDSIACAKLEAALKLLEARGVKLSWDCCIGYGVELTITVDGVSHSATLWTEPDDVPEFEGNFKVQEKDRITGEWGDALLEEFEAENGGPVIFETREEAQAILDRILPLPRLGDSGNEWTAEEFRIVELDIKGDPIP